MTTSAELPRFQERHAGTMHMRLAPGARLLFAAIIAASVAQLTAAPPQPQSPTMAPPARGQRATVKEDDSSSLAAALLDHVSEDFASGRIDVGDAVGRVDLATRLLALEASNKRTGVSGAVDGRTSPSAAGVRPRDPNALRVEALEALRDQTDKAVAVGRMTELSSLRVGHALARARAAQAHSANDTAGELRARKDAVEKAKAIEERLAQLIAVGRGDAAPLAQDGFNTAEDRAALARLQGRPDEAASALRDNVSMQERLAGEARAREAAGLVPTSTIAQSSASLAGARAALAAQLGDQQALRAALAERVAALEEVSRADTQRARLGVVPCFNSGESIVRLGEARMELARVTGDAKAAEAARRDELRELSDLADMATNRVFLETGLVTPDAAACVRALQRCAILETSETTARGAIPELSRERQQRK